MLLPGVAFRNGSHGNGHPCPEFSPPIHRLNMRWGAASLAVGDFARPYFNLEALGATP